MESGEWRVESGEWVRMKNDKIEPAQYIKDALLKVRGKGKDVWTKEGEDVQVYINQLREE